MKKQTKKIALGLTCAMAVSMAAPAVQTAYAGSEVYKVTLGTPEERAIENVTLEIGESIDLNFYGVKDWNQNKANYKCSWSTSGDAVSVNNMGVVTAKKEGSAVVSLSIKDTKTGIYHDVVSTAVLVEAETPEVTETPEMVATPELRYALNEDGASYSVVGLDFYYGDTVIIGAEYEGLPVTAIGPSAFEEKRGLKTAVIAEGITTIGEYAFAFTKVETIQLPRTITTIAESALAYNDLATINYAGTMAEWNAVEKEEYWCNKEDGIEIICSDGIANEKVVLDSVVYKISGDSAGVYVVGLESGASLEAGKELTIAAEVKGFPVTEIASDAFEEEVDLEIVVIPEGVTTIRERAFWWSGLETIQLPSTITTIGYGAFMYSDLATVNYAGTMEEWKAVAKENCAGHIYEVICSDGTVTEKPELSYKLNEDGTSYFVDGIGS